MEGYIRREPSTHSVTSKTSTESKRSKESSSKTALKKPVKAIQPGVTEIQPLAKRKPQEAKQSLALPAEADLKEKRVSFGKRDEELEPHEIQFVQQMWAKAKRFGLESLGWMLFTQIFKLEPKTKKLFPNLFVKEELQEEESAQIQRIKSHACKVVGMLDGVVGMLSQRESSPEESSAAQFLRQLGLQHVAYGVDAQHFEIMGRALSQVMTTTVGQDRFSEGSKHWHRFWIFVTTSVGGAYKRLPSRPRPRSQSPQRPRLRLDENAIQTVENIAVEVYENSPQSHTKPSVAERAAASQHPLGLC
eukprot:TRINITY_DN14756_c0_g1_i1.p1 TRINITY_DN14756_c0_g1~~TRINITY_DN14756_c0_g1_i1.p1  ORF type:complete len:304 (-),score=52.39 TRINITY_DN14756_c0_g1_i1:243-1154(-)